MPNQYDKKKLFEEAKLLRDYFNSNNVPLKFNVSDAKIKQIIDQKYDRYCKAKDVLNRDSRNKDAVISQVKGKTKLNASASAEIAIANFDKKEIDKFVSQTDTKEKAMHFHLKSLEAVYNEKAQDLSERTIDLDKSIDYYSNNRYLEEFGFRATPHCSFGGLYQKTKYPEAVHKEMKDDAVAGENFFVSIKDNVVLSGSPFSFLFEEDFPTFTNEQECVMTNAMLMKDLGNTKSDMYKYKVEFDAFVNCNISYAENHKIDEFLKKNDIKGSLFDYKPENGKEKLRDAILNDHNIVKKDEKDIEALKEGFNMYGKEPVEFPKSFSAKSKAEQLQIANSLTNPEDVKECTKDCGGINLAESLQNDKEAYSKMNGFLKFLSYLVPNSLTKAGQLRDKIAATEKQIKEVGGNPNQMKNDEELQDAIANPLPDEPTNAESKQPEAEKKPLVIEAAKDPLNSSKENLTKEQVNQLNLSKDKSKGEAQRESNM